MSKNRGGGSGSGRKQGRREAMSVGWQGVSEKRALGERRVGKRLVKRYKS